MVRALFIIVLTLYVCFLAAGESTDELTAIGDLIYEDLADVRAADVHQSLAAFSGALRSNFYFRNQRYNYSLMHLKMGDISLAGGMRIADQSHYNIQARLHERLVLGDFRAALGEGLVFAKASGAPKFHSPPHPRTYAPQGAAIRLGHGDWQILGIASARSRDARLADGRISSLPKSKQGYLSKSREHIGALALWYERESFLAGALYYHQSYDRDFADARLDRLLQMPAVFARAELGDHSLSLEAALQKGSPSLKTRWSMQSGAFRQSWCYSYLGTYQRPAYAGKALSLSSHDQRDEISAELSCRLWEVLTLEAASVQNRRLGELSDAHWLSHSAFRIRYRDEDSHLMGSLKLIDREILKEIDSSYISSIPLHYRIRLQGSQRLDEAWEIAFGARYHFQEKQASLSSGSWWQQSVSYQKRAWELEGGYSIWSSTNYRMIVFDDSDLGYEALGQNSFRLEVKAAFKPSSGSIELRARQHLKGDHESQVELRLSLLMG